MGINKILTEANLNNWVSNFFFVYKYFKIFSNWMKKQSVTNIIDWHINHHTVTHSLHAVHITTNFCDFENFIFGVATQQATTFEIKRKKQPTDKMSMLKLEFIYVYVWNMNVIDLDTYSNGIISGGQSAREKSIVSRIHVITHLCVSKTQFRHSKGKGLICLAPVKKSQCYELLSANPLSLGCAPKICQFHQHYISSVLFTTSHRHLNFLPKHWRESSISSISYLIDSVLRFLLPNRIPVMNSFHFSTEKKKVVFQILIAFFVVVAM